MTLSQEEFIKAYKKEFNPENKELRTAEWIHAYTVKRPNYQTMDSRLEPQGKKVFLYSTPAVSGAGIFIVERVLQLEKADFVKSLDKADIAVYFGKYLCDYKQIMDMGETGNSAIWPFLHAVKNRDLSLVVFTNGRLYSNYCQGKCPEDKLMYDLIREDLGKPNKRINHQPLGYPYNDCSILS